MNAWLTQHGAALALAFRRLWSAPLNTLLSLLVIGIALVAAFMLFYYRGAGVNADTALILNAVLLLGAIAAFKATLTLPGIAGIVLTIGMAVDANVLIFERIREELRTGKSIPSAVDAGFSKAWWTIHPVATTVTSVPGRFTSAFPSGTSNSSSGTSPETL